VHDIGIYVHDIGIYTTEGKEKSWYLCAHHWIKTIYVCAYLYVMVLVNTKIEV